MTPYNLTHCGWIITSEGNFFVVVVATAVIFVCLFAFWVFWDMVSLCTFGDYSGTLFCRAGEPWTHINSFASASWSWGLWLKGLHHHHRALHPFYRNSVLCQQLQLSVPILTIFFYFSASLPFPSFSLFASLSPIFFLLLFYSRFLQA